MLQAQYTYQKSMIQRYSWYIFQESGLTKVYHNNSCFPLKGLDEFAYAFNSTYPYVNAKRIGLIIFIESARSLVQLKEICTGQVTQVVFAVVVWIFLFSKRYKLVRNHADLEAKDRIVFEDSTEIEGSWLKLAFKDKKQ